MNNHSVIFNSPEPDTLLPLLLLRPSVYEINIDITDVCLHPVTLTASSPAYFRGFILIALKEGAEGDRDEDYTGNFQVRYHLSLLSTRLRNKYSCFLPPLVRRLYCT